MVGVFKRSLSFPNKNPNNINNPKRPTISHHIRSVSLPCRSHPLVSHLTDEIDQLSAWSSSSSTQPLTSAWLCDGLSRLKDAHDALDDFLQLPESQATLRRHPHLVDDLLEDFLRFVDAYGIFQTSALALNEDQLSAQLAIRKRNDAGLTPFATSCKKLAKEMSRLASYVVQQGSTAGSTTSAPSWETSTSVAESELVRMIGDVIDVTVIVSVALFGGLAASFSSRRSWRSVLGLLGVMKPINASASNRVVGEVGGDVGIEEFRRVVGDHGILLLRGLKKKGNEEVKVVIGRFREMEECLGCLEIKGRDLLRSLIRTRVSLLNTLT